MEQSIEKKEPVQLATAQHVVQEGQERAKQLMDIVVQNKLAKNFGGEKDHIEVEGWQTLGRFYAYTARTKEGSVQYVKYGDVEGFTAYAEIIDKDGNVVGGAEASCMRDEPKWNKKNKYKWVNGSKVLDGEETVPLYTLKSMAQTRAVSKAFRQVLSWVVVLAGYAPTPAEEMEGVILDGQISEPRMSQYEKARAEAKARKEVEDAKKLNGYGSLPTSASDAQKYRIRADFQTLLDEGHNEKAKGILAYFKVSSGSELADKVTKSEAINLIDNMRSYILENERKHQ